MLWIVEKIMKIKLSTIKPNPINDDIYSPTDLSELKQSLEREGQLEPIAVNTKYTIISGHRRYYSMKQLKWKECEVRVVDVKNDVIALIEFNRTRQKTPTDYLREGRYLEQEYKKNIGGQGTRTDLREDSKSFRSVQDISSRLGIGTSNYKKLKAIHNYKPELLDSIEQGKTTITTAYKMVQNRYMKKLNVSKGDKTDYKLRSFLKDDKPSPEALIQTLKKSYPYNFIKYDTSQMNEWDEKRDELIDNLKFYKSLDEQEIVRVRKWEEIKTSKFDTKLKKKVKKEIYQFENLNNEKKTIEELHKINPILTEPRSEEEFKILRTYTSSFEWVQSVGRVLKYIVRNESDDRILGMITIASDVSSIECREKYLGWTENDKFEKKKINNSAIASTICGVQPFGHNFLGSKLIAGMVGDIKIREDWKKKYKDELVGITTTSLYGGFSIYNSHPHWKKIGNTKGLLNIKPNQDLWKYWMNYMKEQHSTEYDSIMKQDNEKIKTSPKQKLMSLLYTKLGIKSDEILIEQSKGVYYALMYHNGREFLRNEIVASELEPNMKYNKQSLMDWWIPKAEKRYKDLRKKKSIQTDTLWYEDLTDDEMKNWLNVKGINI